MTEQQVEFSWDGEPVEGRAGEPIAVALWRAGYRVQTRSIKYHRARGPQCFSGGCPGCLVRVDGVPNVPGCRVPVCEDMEVESQVGIPSASRDVLSVVDRLFEHFDHERRLVRPRAISAVYEAIARRLAGFGTAPTGEVQTTEGRRLSAEVLVVGGGPAGLGAAAAALEAGADVLLCEPDALGGCLLHTPRKVDGGPEGQATGPALARSLADRVETGARVLDGAVLGLYEDGVALTERTDDGLAVHRTEPDKIVLATGAHEQAALVPGNDVPGVLGARAARKLLNRWGVPPGERVVVADPGREGRAFVEEARGVGLDVRIVADVEGVDGSPSVEQVRADGQSLDAQALVVDPGLVPAPELVEQAGIPFTYEAALGGRVPLHDPDGSTPVPDAFVAGGCAGIHAPGSALAQGRRAGQLAAGKDPEVGAEADLLDDLREAQQAALERIWRRT